jgi:hypothetical protein
MEFWEGSRYIYKIYINISLAYNGNVIAIICKEELMSSAVSAAVSK